MFDGILKVLRSIFVKETEKKEVEQGRVYRRPEDVVVPPIPRELEHQYHLAVNQLEKMREFPMQSLEYIYGFLDIYNRFISTFAVCEKGCSACCSIPVNISGLEAEYIKNKTGIKPNTSLIASSVDGPCPFLGDEGSCTIYEARPFNCRTFHALDDPKYCETKEPHAVYGVSSIGYGSDVLAHLASILRSLNRGKNQDIRVFFPRV